MDFDEILQVDNARLLELDPEVVAFTGALADAGEDGEAAVLGGDVVDELLDDDGLADAGAAEEADLAALQEGLDQVDDLDAGLEHLLRGGLFIERRRVAMDRPVLGGVDRTKFVDGLSEDVEHAAQRRTADGHRNRRPGVDGLHAADHAFGRDHRDGADAAFAEVLLHFDDNVERRGDGEAVTDDAQRLVDRRHRLFFKLDVNGRAADGDHFSDVVCHSRFSSSLRG